VKKWLLIAALIVAPLAAADPLTDMLIQSDVVAWHLSQGESRAQVCARVVQYFEVDCVDTGVEFRLTRGHGTGITYLNTISAKGTPK
jgi:hypothetical protein